MRKTIKLLTAACLFAVFTGTVTVTARAEAQKSPRPVTLVTAQEDYSNIAVSQVTDYVNIREQATTNSKIVGKIYNNCAATILETVEGEGGKWYRIQSGSVTGYMKAQYFITGAEAEKLAQSIGREFATIHTDSLRLREQPDLNSATLTMLSSGAQYVVLEDAGDFYKVEVDADLTGYIAKSYCKTTVEFDQAVSLEEERAKLEENAQRKREAESAIAALEQVKRVEAKRETDAGNNVTLGSAGVGVGSNVTDGSAGTQAAGEQGAGGTGTGSGHTANGADGGSLANGNNANGNNTGGASGGLVIAENPTKPENSQQSSAPAVTIQKPSVGTSNGTNPNSTNPNSNLSGGAPSGGSGTQQGSASSAVVTATRTAIVAYAKQFLGNPYVYGGTSLTNGSDCSGFTQQIFAHFGITTGRTSRDQAAKGREILVASAQLGDLLFYASGSTINHVAIYIGNGKVIHSSNPTTGVTISPYNYRTPCKAVTFLD